MTSDTSPSPQAPPPPPPPMAATRGWTGSDLAVGGALVVLLIALFLPWFSSTVSGTLAISGTGDGPTSHGYLWVVFVLVIVALFVLVARDAIARVPGNLPSSEQMLVGATGLALLLTILGVALKPSPGTTGASALLHVTVTVGWSYGGFVALVAALIAFVAAFRAGGPQQLGRRMTMPSLRRPGTTA
jgi:hypothetical protein